MVVWSGNEGVAWLQEPDLTRNEIVALRIGESVGPWKLTRFLDNGVELEGPAGKVLIPLHNAGGGGTAVAAGAPAGPAAGADGRRPVPRDDASRVATPPAPVSPAPGYVGESNRPAPNAERAHRGVEQGAGGESAAAGRECAGPAPRGRARRRQPGWAWSGHVVRPPRPPAASAVVLRAGGTNQNVIQFPVGGGKQGIRELFGSR